MEDLCRIIPLTVILYRVLMVCHVDFCYKYGEKNIRDFLFRLVAVEGPLISYGKTIT